MIDNVKRENPEEKVKDFFTRSIDLMYAVEHQAHLAKTKKLCCGFGRFVYFFISSKLRVINLHAQTGECWFS